ncbi:hypothetical protein FH608_014650 [Nonomuraea phyllanthi]|uniref:Uncharacterized protein n=1 Tax=Nonomuraea phyllanthi TaxID=2219224 RepID=A0A5C4WJN0_9ACTN|nr:hypothetical protein [Nonomuraea phyllanthi]KAB8194461.1 hypothetical protein FH608_014650 [Nonomuraea phyllanthi]QFY08888.1 hypothetical protein GBF35_21400 [Nonomuraea phyllanthi]
MGIRRVPLLPAAALALVAIAVAGPAAADRDPWPRPVPQVSVRPPAPPKNVTVGPRVSVPRVRTWRSPSPHVSIKVRGGKRPAKPAITLPHVTVYRGGVCTGGVQVGECPRKRPHRAHRPPPPPRATPVRIPTPSPTPSPKATPGSRFQRAMAEPARRKSPMATVLVMAVVVTAITSTTAVAFRSRR